MLLIGNGRMITWNDEIPFFENGCIAIENNEIIDYGTTIDLKEKYKDAEFYDAAGRLIMPGLINTHTHIYSSFARGLSLPQTEPNKDFFDILTNMWWRIDKILNEDDNLYSAYSTGLESVRYGVTTLFDHHASQNAVTGSLFAIERALDNIGLRASLCYEVSDRDGADTAKAAIAENIAFINHAKEKNSELTRAMLGLHASFTLSEHTLAQCVAAMGSKNAGFHVHCAEGIGDLHDSLNKYGKRVIERLHDAKILGEKTLAIHNVHINSAEIDLLKTTNTPAVHNPESNMGNAVGCSPVLQMINKGILMGLGTDAYTQDMFESLKVENLIHKHHQCNPSIGFMESIDMLFKNNSKICARFWDKPLGIIKKGAYADVIVVDYIPHTPLNENTIAGHVMFGLMGRAVDTTIINGKFIMKDRVMQTVDEQKILSKARTQSADFWKRVIV